MKQLRLLSHLRGRTGLEGRCWALTRSALMAGWSVLKTPQKGPASLLDLPAP